MQLGRDIHPKELIAKISEQLLNDFSQVALLDKYDVYEVLMEYWAETMQDDVYAVCYGGYEAGREIAYEYVTKKKKKTARPSRSRPIRSKALKVSYSRRL